MGVQESITELLEPVIASLGLILVDVEYGGSTLRVVVDQSGGITTDQLAGINRAISPLLDEHDPIPGRYTLEVSSPGVERPLRRLDHFERAVGENVVVKLLAGVEPRRLKGRLDSVEGSTLRITASEIDGAVVGDAVEHLVAVADIDRARTVFEWGPGPKPGQSSKPKPTPQTKSTGPVSKPELKEEVE